MTISYSGSFFRLLLRWKGSIWRSVWKELIVYLAMYYVVRLFYLVGLDYLADNDDTLEIYRKRFETLCRMFDTYTRLIPLTFLLGFYVLNVVARWWRQFECLPWPEDLVSILCTVIPSNDQKSRQRRHMIVRYAILSAVLAWRDISSKIRLRFPTMKSLVDAGLLMEKELESLEVLHVRTIIEFHRYSLIKRNKLERELVDKYETCANLRWMAPLHWIQQLLRKEEEEHLPTVAYLNHCITELKQYRQSLRKLFYHDWVCVPLVYTQVAALATYAFFFFALFGRQPLITDIKNQRDLDLVLPFFTIVQFLFFVGWFKIGQDLMRPFGLDDDDIELNYILDRNISTSFAIIHSLQAVKCPEFQEDPFWKSRNECTPIPPHSLQSENMKQHRPKLHVYVKREEDERTACLSIKKPVKQKKHIDW